MSVSLHDTRGERVGGAKKKRGGRKGTPAIRTGLFGYSHYAHCFLLIPFMLTVNTFTNQKLARPFTHE